MQNRERGAAHINIYYFLVLLVLFLGALWFGYVQLTQNNQLAIDRYKAQVEEAKARASLNLYVEYVREITAVLGEAGQYMTSKNVTHKVVSPEGVERVYKPDPIPKATIPGALTREIKTFSQRLQIPGAISTPISALFGAVSELTDSLRNAQKDADTRLATVSTEKGQADTAYNTSSNTQNANLATANTRFARQMAVANQENQRQVRLNTDKNNEIRRLQDDMNRMRNEHQAAVTKLEKEKNLLQLTNEHLVGLTRLINPPDQPDAGVISASMAARVAFIDIGRKDMLPLGTVFKVTAPRIDGKSDGKIKALGTVTEVMQDRAKIKLFNVADRYDPVVRGDIVVSELYSPHVKRNIALIGRFTYPYPKGEVKRLLERLGNRVLDKVGIDVDLVVVGNDTINETGDGLDDITTTAEYKFAENQRIEIITLNKIRDLLKLSN
ncbi:MAG: hypothetical protein ACYTGW_04965 [Planctomycetota bacterium]|jgi:hypothetical protein